MEARNSAAAIPAEIKNGIIVKGIGGFYYVDCGQSVVECRARGRFRRRELTPMVGDRVTVAMLPDGKGTVEEIEERTSELTRPPVANIDRLFIVLSPRDPEPNLFITDQMTAVAVNAGIDVVIVINKSDLSGIDDIERIYSNAGFEVVRACAADGRGTDELREMIKGHICAFAGSSGVGKSSLMNRLVPDRRDMQVGGLSEKTRRGRHTTRHVELFSACGGRVADTPGFSAFDFERLEPLRKDELQYAFAEFGPYVEKCRFTGCSHTTEKGCAVLEALAEGKIEKSRHQSYTALYEQAKSIKDWERRG